MFSIKYFIIISFILIISSCTHSNKKFPERKEIQWTFFTKQELKIYELYKLIYNSNGKLIQTSDSGNVFLYVSSEINSLNSTIIKFNKKGEVSWENNYSDSLSLFNAAYDIIEGENKSLIFVGQNDKNAWIVKVDSTGNVLWQKSLGNEGDILTSIALSSDHNYIAAGVSYYDLKNNIMSNSDVWLTEISPEGKVIWETKYGKKDRDEFVYNLTILPNQDFVVAGYAASTPSSKENTDVLDALLIKFNKKGEVKKYNSFGGNGWDILYSITIDNEGNIVCAGQTESNKNNFKTNGLTDAFVAKLDTSLNILWTKNYGGSLKDFAHCIITTKSNDYIFSGTTQSDNSDVKNKLFSPPDCWKMYDSWLVKINKDGKIIWDVSYGGSENDYGYCLSKGCNNNIIIGLKTSSRDGDINYCERGFWLAQLKTHVLDSLYKR